VHCLVLKVGDEQEVPLLVYHPTNLRQSAKRAGKSSLFQSKSSFKPVFKGVANAMARLEIASNRSNLKKDQNRCWD
jgi:hypothetical protein